MTNPKVVETSSSSKKCASQPTNRKGMRSMLSKSFSFSLKKSRRPLTPMRQAERKNSNSTNDTASVSSSEEPQQQPPILRARFSNNPKSKKVKKQITPFPKTTGLEAPLYWYNEVEMLDMMEDVKHTVKQYLRKCERYCVAMEKIADKCSQAPEGEESITSLLDSKVLLQIADAAARGVEEHVAPRRQFTRLDVVEAVVALQRSGASPAEVAQRYEEWSKTARLIAKTMGDGDALVADKILKRGAPMLKRTTSVEA